MARPRQDPKAVRFDQFRKAVAHGQVDADIRTYRALEEATGIPYATLWKRLNDPEKLTVADLSSLIEVLPIEPQAVLLLLGYTRKDVLKVIDCSA